MFGAVKLLGDQSSIPCQNGVGFGNASNLSERFAAKALSDFGQRDSFRVGKPQSRRELGPQDAILSGEVFVPQQKLLVDGASHVGQKSYPACCSSCSRLSYCVAASSNIFTIRVHAVDVSASSLYEAAVLALSQSSSRRFFIR